jgi:hypothetical protein
MRFRNGVAVAVVGGSMILTNCSSSSAPLGSGGASDIDSGASLGGGSLSGTINGASFTPASAVSFVTADNTIDLVFSDKPDLCSRLAAGKLSAGETLVQLLSLVKGADGNYAPAEDPGDVKVVSFSASCGVAYKASATSNSDFTITLSDANAIAGTAVVTFDSGSKVSGSFSAPPCATQLTETDVCQQ